MKRLSCTLGALALAGTTVLVGIAPASAAHCTDSGGPGNSDFADHVRASNGSEAHREGEHKGWASCNPNSPNFVPPANP